MDTADFSPHTQRSIQSAILVILTAYFAAGVYALLAVTGFVPPTPWSPVGMSQQVEQPAPQVTTTRSV